ncbi:MAG: flagellar export protein FliJ [Nitrosomonas sp.]|nr:flagellar export protein FliJ [Nitrosomonas sp.]
MSSSLKILIELAQKQSDDSAKQLGKLNFQKQEADQKLHLLLEYRHSYQARFQDLARNGIDHIEWQNFVTFINKLDAAITEQRQAVAQTLANRVIGSENFVTCQRKLKSYNTLSKRQQKIKDQRQMKHEQRLQDEHAAKSSTQKKYPPEDN